LLDFGSITGQVGTHDADTTFKITNHIILLNINIYSIVKKMKLSIAFEMSNGFKSHQKNQHLSTSIVTIVTNTYKNVAYCRIKHSQNR